MENSIAKSVTLECSAEFITEEHVKIFNYLEDEGEAFYCLYCSKIEEQKS